MSIKRRAIERMGRPFRRWLTVETDHLETRGVTSRDGLRLALHRVPGNAGRQPVVMVHGLASNRFALDFPGRSLARFLAEAGWDVWLVELRGSGESDRPKSWTFDDHVMLDLPALIDEVRDESGHERVDWVGHSMGGLLLWCYQVAHGSDSLHRAVTIGSALDYREGETGYRALLPLKPVLERLPTIPWGALTHLCAPMLGRGRIRSPMERFNVVPENVEGRVVRQLHGNAFGPIPTPLLSSLATTFEDRGLRSPCGRRQYWASAERCRTPTLLLAGEGDAQVSVAAVEATSDRIGGASSVASFGRRSGHQHDYGHFDLLVGNRARQEVWPSVVEGLRGARAERAEKKF